MAFRALVIAIFIVLGIYLLTKATKYQLIAVGKLVLIVGAIAYIAWALAALASLTTQGSIL